MADKTPPDWVFERACSWVGRKPHHVRLMNVDNPERRAISALCRMIEKYEQPPLDRKMICARETAAGWPLEVGDNGYPTKEALWDFAVCAIELWEEGFGK